MNIGDNTLKACLLATMGLTVAVLGALVALGHNSGIIMALIAVCGGSGVLGVWERLKR